MYEQLKNHITHREYILPEITERINTMYIEGHITLDEKHELEQLALEHLSVETERPDWADIVQSLADRVAALEALHAKPDTGDYPEWVKWDGLTKDYQYGAIVSHNGKLWQSIYDGQNVWEPGTLGTESMWAEYTPESGEENGLQEAE